MLFRGVRGELADGFWSTTDAMGHISAVDLAFMSTSKNKETPIECAAPLHLPAIEPPCLAPTIPSRNRYMASGQKNVLWRMHANVDTDAAFHRGADITMFSQYAKEDEVLFPPCTMLIVQKNEAGGLMSLGEESRAEGSASTTGFRKTRFTQDELVKHAEHVRSQRYTLEKKARDSSSDPDDVDNKRKHYVEVDVLPCFL